MLWKMPVIIIFFYKKLNFLMNLLFKETAIRSRRETDAEKAGKFIYFFKSILIFKNLFR